MEEKSARFFAVEEATIYNSMHVLLRINAIFLYFLFLSQRKEVVKEKYQLFTAYFYMHSN